MILIQILWQEDASLVWVTPFARSLYMELGKLCFPPLPACPLLASWSIPSLALESTTLGIQHIKTS